MNVKRRNKWMYFVLTTCVLLTLWIGIPTFRKAGADATVRELCAKDGKLSVYEIVDLPPSRFNSYGRATFAGNGVLPPLERYKRPETDFFYTDETTWILPEASFEPALWRSHQILFRATDKKILGEAISYSRRGGDPIGPWHPSSFGCPDHADITILVEKVFVRQK